MAATDILTLAEARRGVNLGSSTTHDAELGMFVTGITGRIDALCGPVVNRTITGERHDGGKLRIFLEESPAFSVTSVSEWLHTTETVLTAETDGTKPSQGYLLDHVGNLSFIWRRAGGSDTNFAEGRRNVVVTYVAGRFADTASVDDRFKLAAASILRRLWKREQSSWAQSPDFFGDPDDTRSLGFFRAVDPMVRELLADELKPPPIG